MFYLRFLKYIYKWGGHKFSLVCVFSVPVVRLLAQLQAHPSVLRFVMLGLEPCKPHICSWQYFFTQAAAVSSHGNSWIQFVVFPGLVESASVCSRPTSTPSDTSTGGQQPLFGDPSFSSWGPFSKLLIFNKFNFFSLLLYS